MSRRRAFFNKKAASGPDPDSFIMTFTLLANDSITLPLVNGGTYNFTVEWGDGTSDVITAWNQAERVHNYTSQPAGDYVVTITGTCTRFSFLSVTTSRLKIKNVIQWGDPGFTVLDFFNCTNLNSLPAESIKFNGTSLQSIFWQCSGITSIPVETFSDASINSVTNAAGLLNGTRITSIPVGLLDQFTALQLFNSGFSNNPSLTAIPSGLFDNCTAITTLANCFQSTGITSIPSNLLDSCISVTNLSGLFLGCTSLTASPPVDLFRYNTSVTPFSNTFNNTRFSSIPTDLFRYNTAVTTFQECFINSAVTTFPPDTFKYNTSVTNFQSLLFNNTSFTTIPVDLFRYNTAVTNMGFVFYNTRITSIPTDLFRYNTAVTTFSGTFALCSTLTSLPSELFRYNTSVLSFGNNIQDQGTFSKCSGLTSLPSDLFQYNINATSFIRTFSGCNNLTSIPTTLFDTNVNVTSYLLTFLNCTALSTSVSSLVSGMDMTKVTTTNQMFSGCTNLTGNGQDLIDKPKAAGYTVGTGTDTGSYRTFFNCTSLTDFATISANYK